MKTKPDWKHIGFAELDLHVNQSAENERWQMTQNDSGQIEICKPDGSLWLLKFGSAGIWIAPKPV